MTTRAAAFVRSNGFLPATGTGGAKSFDFGSDKRVLRWRIGDGGTLWLITSHKLGKAPIRVRLAYKLVDCHPVRPESSLLAGRWRYVARAGDWRHCSRNLPDNDATPTMRRLRFTSGRPMRDCVDFATHLLSIPELSIDEVSALERLQHRIEGGGFAFAGYARDDIAQRRPAQPRVGIEERRTTFRSERPTGGTPSPTKSTEQCEAPTASSCSSALHRRSPNGSATR